MSVHDMESKDLQQLGRTLRDKRTRQGLSIEQLRLASGVDGANIYRLETGGIKKPRPDHLVKLANALQLSLPDLYAMAGLPFPKELPSFSPYLRSRYSGLSDEARRELETAFEQIAAKHGYDPDGPKPGQDEH